jgi:L-aspartate oxidase
LLQNICNVTIVTKGTITDSNSYRAQGGIAFSDPSDSKAIKLHVTDTFLAGSKYGDLGRIQKIIETGSQEVHNLIKYGLEFDKNADGSFQYALEAAHSYPRVLHLDGDQSGKGLVDFLLEKLHNVTILEHHTAVELVREQNSSTPRCLGVFAQNSRDEQVFLSADVVVLATGGLGQLYSQTSNAQTITGDGLILAKKFGCVLKDLEMIQFHPTILEVDGKAVSLVSEAVRGAGAKLVDENGEQIMKNVHPLKDLAPRDIVSREVYKHKQRGEAVFLDISAVEHFESRFPSIAQTLSTYQIDKLVPITVGAHFLMGGVEVDQEFRCGSNLYAVGEVADYLTHGANRLASNSLLECLASASIVANSIRQNSSRFADVGALYTNSAHISSSLLIHKSLMFGTQGSELKKSIQNQAMLNLAPIRNFRQIEQFLAWCNVQIDVKTSHLNYYDHQMLELAKEIAQASLGRTSSLGAHYLES